MHYSCTSKLNLPIEKTDTDIAYMVLAPRIFLVYTLLMPCFKVLRKYIYVSVMYRLCIGYVSVILYAGIEKDTRKIASSNRACMTVVSYRLLLGGVKFIRGYERACDSML